MAVDTKKIDFDVVVGFVSAYGWGVVARGVVSFGVVVALLALYYAFAPRRESWQQEVAMTLETNGGSMVYPNDRHFSASDLLSASVLNRVWTKHGLADKVRFENFCKWFSIVSYDKERAKIDAEYQSKMAKRNITVTELVALQREYEAKLASRDAVSRYTLAMRPNEALPKEESVSLIRDIPAEWFAEYSVLNAPKMPSVMRASVLSAYVKFLQTGDGRSLELIDTLWLYVQEIGETCGYVRHHLTRGRNVTVDGVDLGAYEARLDLAKAEILRLKNRLLVNSDPEDMESFVTARLDDMACETLVSEEKANAVLQTIELLAEASGRRQLSATKQVGCSEGTVMLQADASFFHDFAAMVRRDSNLEAIRKYADELAGYRKEQAGIKAYKLYYDQIGDYVKKTRARADVRQVESALAADVAKYAAELIEVGDRVVAFRDRCLQVYHTPDMFYALPTPVTYSKGFIFPLSRFALGLLAMWCLYNLAALVLVWDKSASRSNCRRQK